MVYLKSVENVITLGKLIGPLLLFCLPLLSILFLNDLARPVMGTIFLVMSVCRMSAVVCQINCVGGITYGQRACSKSFFLAVKPVTPVLFISYTLEL